jgi:FAD/FMN-containing dehydrogenase
VSGEGEILNCSLGERRDLFEAVLAGQGQCALIARVTLKLTPAPDMVREYLLPYADLQTILSDGAKLANDQRFDGFVALIAPTPSGWSYVLTAIRHCQWTDAPDDAALLADLRFQHGAEKIRNVGYLEYADVVPPFDPAQVHADLGLCIPQSKLEPFFTDIIDRLSPSDLGGVAAVRLFFLQRAPFTRPLLRIPSEECFSYAAILRSQTNDADTIAKQLSGNRTLFELANNVDGTLYPFAALEMHRSDWRQHYGEQWRSLMTMKRRCDPDNVFASGPNLS